MEKLRKILVNISRDKKKLTLFLGTEFVIFTILVSLLTVSIINKNTVVETAEIADIEIEQNETPEIKEEIQEEPVQELTEEQQEEAEKEENIENNAEQENTSNSNQTSKEYGTSYYIKVNYGANVVTIYTKDAEGNYTPIKAMVCSTGRATPRSGVYTIKNAKYRWGALFGGVWGQYTTKIVGNILFHSVPYLSADSSNLEYWEYDKLGTTASAGCVRLRVCDAKWIYDCIPVGTPVEFYSDSNPGPLGKPSAQKISGNEACRGWDPTDPSANNPWRNVNKEPETQPQQQVEVKPTPVTTLTPEPVKQEPVKQEVVKKEPEQQQTNNTQQNKAQENEQKQENKGKQNKQQEIEKQQTTTETVETHKDNKKEQNTENKTEETQSTQNNKTENKQESSQETENKNQEQTNKQEEKSKE